MFVEETEFQEFVALTDRNEVSLKCYHKGSGYHLSKEVSSGMLIYFTFREKIDE